MRGFIGDQLVSLTYCRTTCYRKFNISDMTSPVKFLAFAWYINLSGDRLEMIYELRGYSSISRLYKFLKRKKNRGRGKEAERQN